MSVHANYTPELRQRILDDSLTNDDRAYIVRAMEHLVELEEELEQGTIIRVKDSQLVES
jgi:hypothetical protein